MEPISESTGWYAVRTKNRHEVRVAGALQGKGYDTFVPLYKVKRRWSDRIRSVEVPLFPTYAFCRFDREIRFRIVSTPGVIQIVGFGAGPAQIDPEEINSLKIALKSGSQCVPHTMLRAGQKVRIIKGPLAGVTGIYVAGANKRRIVLTVSLIQTAAAVEVDESFIVPDAARVA